MAKSRAHPAAHSVLLLDLRPGGVAAEVQQCSSSWPSRSWLLGNEVARDQLQ